MKNIHVLSTDKPSKLFIDIDDKKLKICVPLGGEHMMNQNIYITSDEEIKEGDWVYSETRNKVCKVTGVSKWSHKDDYLIDLDNEEMHQLSTDGIWYEMDAGRLHTATNFGRLARIQMVVRKLLVNPVLDNAVSVKITSSGYSKDDARFIFDNTLSGWLNSANKKGLIQDFKFGSNEVTFSTLHSAVNDLLENKTTGFNIEIL
jgi:hypothetical protein